ncbi:MAG TPA: hypothetical protein VGD78_10070 [Chthoniobacterales bacterium]
MKLKPPTRFVVYALAVGWWASARPAFAVDVVHDPIHTVLNILQQLEGQISQASYHAQDVAKYGEMIQKQVEQIRQLTTVINQNVDQLKRFGNPDTYVNLLGLNDLLEEVQKAKAGTGQTMADVRQTATGARALQNRAGGLYDDLSALTDKFGQRVQLQSDRFRKFGMVQDLYDGYNRELQATNQSVARLQDDKAETLQQLNAAGSLVETQKFAAKLQALQASLDNLYARAHDSAFKVLVQEAANRNDEARRAEAAVEKHAQEAAADGQRFLELGREAVHVLR